MLAFASLQKVAPPPTGWIKAIRNAIGMSMLQLGNRLSITKQSVQDMENREKDGSISIKALRKQQGHWTCSWCTALCPTMAV